MEPVDSLLHAGWVLPVDPGFALLENHSVAVRNGKIVAIVPTEKALFPAHREFHLPGHLLMPGLINAHGHAAMCLFRGLADDFPLMTWLQEYIWPAEQQHVDAGFVADGTRLAVAEMIRSGTTCFSDMYFYAEAAAQVADESGIRAQLAFPIFDIPTRYAGSAREYLEKGLAARDRYRSSSRIRFAFGPHAPYTLGEESLALVAEMATKHPELRIQMHLHETAAEVSDAVKANGQKPLQRIAASGLLDHRFQAVHMTALDDDDIRRMAEAKAHLIHCPESNLKLASGFCPVARCLEAGINVALGTDGAASNNDLDLFGEMRTAAMLAKSVAGNTSALPARDAIRMATIHGARALGIDHETGSLESGKSADIIAIDLSGPEQQPLYNPVSQLVYTNLSAQISHSWVEGKLLMENRQLTTLDSRDIIAKAALWKERIHTIARTTHGKTATP
jgi:5-methylthioadenosine/S-adenosylhomocysteine deaminase